MMSSDIITVFEDQGQKLNLSDTQFQDLMAFKPILDNNFRLDYDGTLQIMHYVGFLSHGKTRLQILPKIYRKTGINSSEETRESIQILYNLLRESEYNKVLELPKMDGVGTGISDLLEIFISIFANKVIKTYSTKMNREYVEIEENSAFIKGKIDFSKSMRLNVVRKDLHYINFQSYEIDNLINNIIKTVALKLLTVTNQSDNRKNLKKALMNLDDAKEIQLSAELFARVIFSRLNRDFQTVFEMAKMFYFNMQPENYNGDDAVISFLIPVNKLFEHYLYKIFTRIDGYDVVHEGRRSFAKTETGANVLTLKPDILVFKDKKICYIADAKYKDPVFDGSNYTKIHRDDIYQLYAYAKSYGLSEVALIYPGFDAPIPLTQKIIISDNTGSVVIKIISVDLKSNDHLANRHKIYKDIFQEMLS